MVFHKQCPVVWLVFKFKPFSRIIFHKQKPTNNLYCKFAAVNDFEPALMSWFNGNVNDVIFSNKHAFVVV